MGSDHREKQWQRGVVALKSLHHTNHFKWHVMVLSGLFQMDGMVEVHNS